jgi:antitoxin ParD1/3/4
MNVSLTPELEELVAEKVRSGRYTSASEVIREALRLFETQEQLREKRLDEAKTKIARGIAQLDAGQSFTKEEVHSRIARRRRSK